MTRHKFRFNSARNLISRCSCILIDSRVSFVGFKRWDSISFLCSEMHSESSKRKAKEGPPCDDESSAQDDTDDDELSSEEDLSELCCWINICTLIGSGECVDILVPTEHRDGPELKLKYRAKVGDLQSLRDALGQHFVPGTDEYRKRLRKIKENQRSYEDELNPANNCNYNVMYSL
ncbi:hypothetical protein PHJA_000880300 [Phtheirospermum japonicum]|uniref:Uncharacterized protein n=1 Tax=Phtheirospermum japonicum TaxID=374723 RepID=A0A830BKF9_9LAMI|nr:hypothetical protein PHJA_000880300 [Phtheirospermum japonicum]